jgi:hypothetical protein
VERTVLAFSHAAQGRGQCGLCLREAMMSPRRGFIFGERCIRRRCGAIGHIWVADCAPNDTVTAMDVSEMHMRNKVVRYITKSGLCCG